MQANSNLTEAPIERRRQPRLNFTEPIQFRNLLKPDSLFHGSLACDLSIGGLRIRNFTPMVKGDQLVLLMALPGSRPLIRVVARVAWQIQRPFSSGYETGLQFVGIDPDDWDSIAGFVERGVVS